MQPAHRAGVALIPDASSAHAHQSVGRVRDAMAVQLASSKPCVTQHGSAAHRETHRDHVGESEGARVGHGGVDIEHLAVSQGRDALGPAMAPQVHLQYVAELRKDR